MQTHNKRRAASAALLTFATLVLAIQGCSKNDPTLTAAPPTGQSASPAGNTASPSLLATKRSLAGQPPEGMPPKPAQPFNP